MSSGLDDGTVRTVGCLSSAFSYLASLLQGRFDGFRTALTFPLLPPPQKN